MLPVLRTQQAEDDLGAILSYLEERSPRAAERLAVLIDEKCALIGQFPQLGRARDDLAPGLRSLPVDSYVLFYRTTEDNIQIIRILHGRRDIDSIMREDNGS